jgi:hypothetical protein
VKCAENIAGELRRFQKDLHLLELQNQLGIMHAVGITAWTLLVLSILSLCKAFSIYGLRRSALGENEQIVNGQFIFEVGLPKSGTTSMLDGFTQLGMSSTHFHFPQEYCRGLLPIPAVTVSTNGRSTSWSRITSSDGCYVGMLLQKALSVGRKPLDLILEVGSKHGLPKFQGFFQLDVCRPKPYNFSIFPQIFGLDQLTAAYPDAYYIMTIRSSLQQHVASMNAWADMVRRFQGFGYLSMFPGQSKNKTLLENGAIMIDQFENITRSYFKSRPHLKYLEVCLEDPRSGMMIADFVNISSFPVVHHNNGTYTGGRTPSPTGQHVAAPVAITSQSNIRVPSANVSVAGAASAVKDNQTVPAQTAAATVPKNVSTPGSKAKLLIEVGLPRSANAELRNEIEMNLEIKSAHYVMDNSYCEGNGNSTF